MKCSDALQSYSPEGLSIDCEQKSRYKAAATAEGLCKCSQYTAAVEDFIAGIDYCVEASAALYARKHHSTVYSATTCNQQHSSFAFTSFVGSGRPCSCALCQAYFMPFGSVNSTATQQPVAPAACMHRRTLPLQICRRKHGTLETLTSACIH
jgi:hypothetical protein